MLIIARLDEIKKNRESAFGSFTLAADIDWLIEQAERAAGIEQLAENVGVLNEFLGKNTDLVKGRWGQSVSLIAVDVIGDLQQENARLREALKEIQELSVRSNVDDYMSYGHIAKSALEETK